MGCEMKAGPNPVPTVDVSHEDGGVSLSSAS